jgi:leucyl aminopeptidase (aminopeptidase T)
MSAFLKLTAFLLATTLLTTAAAQPPARPSAEPLDCAKLAHTLVAQCAGVAEGDRVLVVGGPRDLELVEEIAIEVRKLGAHPLLNIQTENLARRMFTDVPARFDGQERSFLLRLAEIIDAEIVVDFMEHPDLLADIPAERRSAADKAEYAVADAILKRNVRQVSLGNDLYPTKARAQQYGLSEDQLAHIFWNAVNADYPQLQAIGEKVQKQLMAASELKITAPNGTDLSVKIDKRPVFVSDGVISQQDRERGGAACQVWLPAGEVYVTPVPGTATGTFVADHYFFEGKPIEGLKLEFKDGKLTAMSAKGDITPLKKLYDAAPAGRDDFAFVDVGINPSVQIPKDSKLVTWMGAGSISIGAGGNTWAGGDNTCPFDLYATINGGTLMADVKPVVEQGTLVAAKAK